MNRLTIKEVHTIVPNKVDFEGPEWKVSSACWRYLFGGGFFLVPFTPFLDETLEDDSGRGLVKRSTIRPMHGSSNSPVNSW